MTNRIAIILGLLIVGVFVADATYFHWELPVFLGRQLMRLTDTLTFWR